MVTARAPVTIHLDLLEFVGPLTRSLAIAKKHEFLFKVLEAFVKSV